MLTFLKPLSLLLSRCRLSILNVSLIISSFPDFALQSPNRMFILYSEKCSKTCCVSSSKLPFQSLFSLDTYTLKTKLHHRPSVTIYEILSLRSSYCCNSWCNSRAQKASSSTLITVLCFTYKTQSSTTRPACYIFYLIYVIPLKTKRICVIDHHTEI